MKRIIPRAFIILAACCLSSSVFGAVVADSNADWSASGTQGENGWTYGLYNATADADGTYASGDFEAFDGTTYIWNGSKWDENNADGDNVPWTEVAQGSGHPNGDNNGDVHYAVRRWESNVSGNATIDYNISKANVNCGNGTTALLYHNGAQIGSQTVASNDGTGVSASVMANISAGDFIDLALSPFGTDDTFADGCDGSNYGMTVDLAAAAAARTIAINFGADEPAGARSDVTGAAGVLGTSNWNNLDLLSGSASGLVDSDGNATGASVEWASNNTWASQGRGEENNTAPAGNDRNLMTGYLDTNGTDPNSVTVSGLDIDGEYNVYVYTKGGVIGRGGDYTIGGQTISHIDTAAFDGNYKIGGEGDVIVFSGVSGDGFTLTGLPINVRAPINGIEISTTLVPEPSSLVLLGMGVLAILGRRNRR